MIMNDRFIQQIQFKTFQSKTTKELRELNKKVAEMEDEIKELKLKLEEVLKNTK